MRTLQTLARRVVTREDASYEAARTMWNRGIQSYPLAIVYCENEEEIRSSILWARLHQVPLRIRSGGHHYNGYSSGNDVLVIDVSEMNEIQVDEKSGSVTVSAGVRNRSLYEALGERGYPFPGGGCPTVGVVGFALGGGWGYSGRMYGLACDHITQIELMNYEGKVLTVNEHEHSELFWALKGSGGGQYGVVLRITFALAAKETSATLIRLEYSGATRREQLELFKLWEEQITLLPKEVNFKLSFYQSVIKGKGMLLLGIYYGSFKEAHEVVAPFIKVGRSVQVWIEPMSVLEANRWIQDAHPDYEHYKSSGRFVREAFSLVQMEEILDTIEVMAQGATYTAVSCYGMGGAMKCQGKSEAAFYYRDSRYILGFQTVWEDHMYSESNKEWFLPRFKRIEALTVGSFVNFPAEEIKDYKKAYWGEYSKKLGQLRSQYDPDGTFSFKQSV